MQKNNSVAVLMAAKNGEKWIEEQINTILTQKNVSIKLFISLDESTDNTEKIINNFIQYYKNIYLFKNNSSSSAKNFFSLINKIKPTEFDYFSLSDQDDIWFENKIASGINSLAYNKCDIYSSNVMAFDHKNRKTLIKKSQSQRKYDYLFEGGGPGNTFIMTLFFFKSLQKNLILNKSLINSIWSHDWYIYAYARSKNFQFFIDSNYYIFYRQHKENVIGGNIGINKFFKRAFFVLSGEALYQSKLISIGCNINKRKDIIKILHKGKLSLYYIILNIGQCRRRLVDRIIMFFSILLLLFTKLK